MFSLRAFGLLSLALSMACLGSSGCKKKPQAPAPAESAKPPPAPPPAAPSLLDHAAKLGFAAHLPKDTEFYFGTIHLKAHIKAIEQSAYGKELGAFIDDKVPAPSAGAPKGKPGEVAKKLWGEDVFIALAAGSGSSLKSLRDINDLYSEITYQALMAGGPLAAATSAFNLQPDKIFQALSSDPVLLQRAAASLAGLRVPGLLVGFKVEKPGDVLKELFPEDKLNDLAAKATTTTALGGNFRVFEFKAQAWITDDIEKKILADLPKPAPDAPDTRALVAKALDDLQAKTVSFAFGSAGGYVILATGSTMSHLRFVTEPRESLLAKPELDFALPYMDRNLTAFVSADAGVFEGLTSDKPMHSILRGLVAGLKGSEMFGPLAARLQPKIAEMAEVESRVFHREHTPLVGVGWWDRGLHFESVGGPASRALDHTQSLRFASLLDDPAVLLGVDYHGNREWAADSRGYFEQWMGLLHLTAGELVKSGLGGPQGVQTFKLLDQRFIPQLVSFYRGSRDIYQNALGTEHAIIVDVGGKLSDLPGMAPETSTQKMIRIAGVHDVKNRALISDNWAKMQSSLTGMIAAVPIPFPLELPKVQAIEKHGITSYSYAIPFMADDLLPSVSVNDHLFIFGTSRNLAESIATRLGPAKPSPAATGLRWRLSFANMRELIRSAPAFSKSPDAEGQAKTAIRWLAPFENLTGKCWLENNRRRDSMSWEIHDVMKYD